MKSLQLLCFCVFCLLAACSPATEPAATAPPIETAAPTATVQATAAPPEAITSQIAALESRGIELIEDDAGWALVTQEGKIVLRTDGESIFIETQDGQLLEYPASSFEVVDTIGVIPLESGETVNTIMVVERGEVDLMFLDTVEKWVQPIELQTNPENIENYTVITFEDLWTGRVLYSEILMAEPFPEGTVVPEEFIYAQGITPGGRDVLLVPRLGGEVHPATAHTYQEGVNFNNDNSKFIAFYKLLIENKEEYGDYYEGDVTAYIGTEQTLMPDGETSAFFHLGAGPEWSTDENYVLPNGERLNLIDSVYTATDPTNNSDAERTNAFPVMLSSGGYTTYSHHVDSDGQLTRTAGVLLYATEDDNDPTSIKEGLRDDLIEVIASDTDVIGYNYVVVGEEIYELQFLYLTFATRELNEDFFSP